MKCSWCFSSSLSVLRTNCGAQCRMSNTTVLSQWVITLRHHWNQNSITDPVGKQSHYIIQFATGRFRVRIHVGSSTVYFKQCVQSARVNRGTLVSFLEDSVLIWIKAQNIGSPTNKSYVSTGRAAFLVKLLFRFREGVHFTGSTWRTSYRNS